ncbi:MAG: hypothetical protein R3C44_06965 [Chloroflexota bacterium]
MQPLLDRIAPVLQREIGCCEDIDDISPAGLRDSHDRGESALANYVTDALYERCQVNGSWLIWL